MMEPVTGLQADTSLCYECGGQIPRLKEGFQSSEGREKLNFTGNRSKT